jgi:hypothetical protein
MLTLEPPFWAFDGIPVFRDHAVTTQFYYGAPEPAVAMVGGRPMFDIFAYRVDLKHSPLAGTTIPDQLGAGFLTMGVECSVSDSQRSGIASKLAQKTGLDPAQMSLYPIPYHKGSVQVIALDKMSTPAPGPDGSLPPSNPAQPTVGRPTFVESIMGSGTPNLTGDLRSIFSLSLSQSGVTFLEALYEDHAAPVGIVYDLAYYGLRPAIQARITADLSNIYEHFGATAGVQIYFIRAEVEAALDKLEQIGVIKVELTSQATGEEAQKSKELAMSLFRDQIVQQLFRPTAPATVPGMNQQQLSQALKQSSGFGVNLTLQYKKTEELKLVTYDFNERAPEERRHAPQGFLPLMVSEDVLHDSIHRVDLNDAFFETLDVLVTGPTTDDFTTLGIRQVEAAITYGHASDPEPPETQPLLFRKESTGDKHVGWPREGRASLDYAVELTYDLDRASGVSGDAFRYALPSRRETSRALLINPNADFGFLDVELEVGRRPDGLAEVEIQLSYESAAGDFTTSQDFRLPAEGEAHPHWRLRTRETELAPYTVSCVWHFADGARYVQPSFESTERLLVIDSPFAQLRTLLVRPNVTSSAITEVTVELEYADIGHAYQRSFLLTLRPPFETLTHSWPILDSAVQLVRYRVTTSEPGFVSEGGWQSVADPSIVVGSAGSRVGKIDVRLIGPLLADLAIDGVRLDLEVEPSTGVEGEHASQLLDDSSRTTMASLTYPPGAALAFRWQTTAFKSDGSIKESEWTSHSNALLVISTRNL